MTLDRRDLIKLSAASAAAMAVGNRISAAAARSIDDIRDSASSFFTGLGYAELPPLDMITGEDFNGGLRFDETRPETPTFSWFSVQPVARVDDIAERDRLGVLAGFTMMGLGHATPTAPGGLFGSVLDFLIGERNLDPERLVYVSTALARPHIDRFAAVAAGRFIERDLDEAISANDGSGYFAPAGHPQAPEYLTVGIYYPAFPSPASAELAYPPADHIEIAEIEILSGDARPSEHEHGALGLERLAMAEGVPVPDFDETRLNLLRIIEDEARREGKPPPPGYDVFAAL